MNAQEVLLDWLDTLATRVQEEIEDTTSPALDWRPDAQANSIALTVWHISRSWDILTTRVLQKEPVEQEIWHQAGWRQKTGYDPRGKGWDGVGNLAGYTQAEVAEIPAQSKADLLTYLHETHSAFHAAIGNVTSEALVEVVEDQSRYDWISNFIRDGYEHLGEIKAINAMWKRLEKK
ncbi:MAG: DinB family protein [Caldilineaceae bacterium]